MGTYDADFYAWANEQAGLLRAGRLHEADIANIAEEIESLGRSEKRELVNRLAVLLAHLLKWNFQPAFRSKSWRLTIEEQRDQLQSHLEDNSSLRSILSESFVKAYRQGVFAVLKETGLERGELPAVSPWTVEQVMDESFYPE